MPTFFAGRYAPLVPLRSPPPSHGALSIASSEASFRKQNLELDHGQSPGSFTKYRSALQRWGLRYIPTKNVGTSSFYVSDGVSQPSFRFVRPAAEPHARSWQNVEGKA